MSRFFNAAANQVTTQPSPASNNLAALTIAGWIFAISVGASGFPIAAKNVNGSYMPYLFLQDSRRLLAFAGAGYLGGIQTATVVAAGTGYNVGDTGFVTGENPTDENSQAAYVVNAVDGSHHVTSVGITGAGTGYNTGITYPTIVGGSQPGTGTGLTIQPTAIINVTAAHSSSFERVTLGVWTHVAMTWDSAGDQLVHLYINGVETAYQIGRTISNAAGDDAAGGWSLGSDPFGDVGITQQKETAVFNRALSAAQIVALAALTTTVRGVADANLVAYWPLTSANPEPDLSGYGVDGAISTTIPAETTAATTPLVQADMVTPAASAYMK